MKKITAYEIALSALAGALATVLLTVGVYTEILLYTGYLFAGIALMLPLSKRSYIGYILAYLSTCILTLVFTSFRFWDLLPFAVFFGLHPLVNELQLKTKLNRWVWFAIKALWFDGTMYLTWKLILEATTNVAGYEQWILPIILVGGTLLFWLFDYMAFRCRALVNVLVKRISKK
jgi:hypothetical protein